MLFDLNFTTPVIPVVVIDNPKNAEPLAKTLLTTGIDAIEITLRYDAALEAIAEIQKSKLPITVLAGTVLEHNQLSMLKQMEIAVALSPGFDIDIVKKAKRVQLPFIPGVTTASEVISAKKEGLKQLKFFPAVSSGGIATLKSFATVFPDISFCPTGGLNADNYQEFLKLPNVNVVGGSWFVPETLIKEGRFDEIKALAQKIRK